MRRGDVMKTHLSFPGIVAVCLVACGGLARAADSTWTGGTDALWSTTTN